MPISSAAWLLLGAAYFLLPLGATARFSLQGGPTDALSLAAYRQVLEDPAFRRTLWLSAQIAVETTVIALALMVPTVFWVHLRVPGARRPVEFLTVLPIVVPPIVLVVGLLDVFRGAPEWFVGTPKILVTAYVILSLPFMFRALDAGLSAVDIRTLTEATQALGGGWIAVMWRVVLPNVRGAALAGAFLTIAIVMGEFTMASLLLFNTFPVYINLIGQSTAYPAAALTVMSFAITWAAMLGLLVLGRGPRPSAMGV